jgi:hypothetical protein
MTIAGIAHAQGVGQSGIADYQPDLSIAAEADSTEFQTESINWSDRNWQGHFIAEYDSVSGQPYSPHEEVVNALSQRLASMSEDGPQQRSGFQITSLQYQTSQADLSEHASTTQYGFQSLVQLSIQHNGCSSDISHQFNAMFIGMNTTGSVCDSNKAADAGHIVNAALPPIARYRVFGVGLLSFSTTD